MQVDTGQSTDDATRHGTDDQPPIDPIRWEQQATPNYRCGKCRKCGQNFDPGQERFRDRQKLMAWYYHKACTYKNVNKNTVNTTTTANTTAAASTA